MLLEKTKIYGVDGVGGSSPTLTRTDGAVGLGYTKGTSEIVSDFDRCYPWSEMQEVVDELGNVFIRIPKFYTKITKNENGTYKHQISGCRYDGFSTLFIDGKGNEIDYILVGKYEGSCDSSDYATAKMKSVSGATVKVNIDIVNYRKACMNNGAGYQQYDFLIDAIIKELWLIEMATTHCQGVMSGFTSGNNAAALITGHTDNIKTASGSYNNNHDLESEPWTDTTCNTDGLHACKYRGIENLWGNTWTFVDGIAFSYEKVYVCTDPTAYESGKATAPYFYMGDRCITEGYAKTIAPLDRNPLMLFTKSVGGSATTYYSDYYYYADYGEILVVGGNWNNGAFGGLWYWSGDYEFVASDSVIGGRLCYKPL